MLRLFFTQKHSSLHSHNSQGKLLHILKFDIIFALKLNFKVKNTLGFT